MHFNWINQKTCGTSMIFSVFTFIDISCTNWPQSASFSSLRLLHGPERDSLLKFTYKLSEKSLHLSNLERQIVTYVLKVLNSYVAQALLFVGKKCKIPLIPVSLVVL